jgi:hypothetical protein
MKQAALWLSLRPALDRLKCLSKIDVWIDHNRHKYWWEFNEAAILSPFAGLATRSGVNLTAHLPMHAADDVPVPPFKIHRRRRQEYFIDSCNHGEAHAKRCPGIFPHLQFPLFDGFADMYPQEDDYDWDASERADWRCGYDLIREVDDFFHNCRTCTCCGNI